MQLPISNKPSPSHQKKNTNSFEPLVRDRPESPTALHSLRRQGGSAWPPDRQKQQQQQQKKKHQQKQHHQQQEKSALNQSGACDTRESRWRQTSSTNGTAQCIKECSCTLINCSQSPCRAANGRRCSAIREDG